MRKMLATVLLALPLLTGCSTPDFLSASCPPALEGGVAERGNSHGCQIDGRSLHAAALDGHSGYWTADPMQAVRATNLPVSTQGVVYLPGEHVWCTDLDAAPETALGHFICA